MNVFEDIGRGFRRSSGVDAWVVLGVVAFVAAVCLVLLLVRHYTSPGARAARLRKSVFRRLTEANHLTPAERDILLQIARHYQVSDPVELFLKRSLFEAALTVLKVDAAVADPMRRKLYT